MPRIKPKLAAMLSVLVLILSATILVVHLPGAAASSTYGTVSVQGSEIMVDGQTPSDKFYGVVDTTALQFAILTYIYGEAQYAGKTSVFNGPDTGNYGPISPNDTPAHFFDRYFALLAYYHCNLVRIGAGDSWGTGIQYDAWVDHHDAFVSLLKTMEVAAEAHDVWVVLVLAGSQDYPAYQFGGSGSVFEPSSSAYHNYIAYSNDVMASLTGLKGIGWFDLFNEPDHDYIWTKYWSSHGGKTAFHAWACSVANDTAGRSSHPRTMGAAGLGLMFGWGKTDFDLCTGTVPFEIASRHYYASNSDMNNFATPEQWAKADGKPLFWGELAYNAVYPLIRYDYAEQAIYANGGQIITSMVLTGTDNYPFAGNTFPTASFTVTPTVGNSSTVFAFDASSCKDPEDATSNLQVRWDWTSDGTYDTTCSNRGWMTESIEYEVLKSFDKVEIRRYPSIILATVRTQFDDAAFSILFDYISGNNRSGEKVPMTAPVVSRRSGAKIDMTAPVISDEATFSFVLPQRFSMLRSLVKRSVRLDYRGHRIERLKE